MPSAQLNESYMNTRVELLRYVEGPGARVLDVGCANGASGRYLLEEGIAQEVVGIEICEDMAELARQDYQRVIVGSLDDDAVFGELSAEAVFDCAILGDVIEHTRSPDRVLQKVVERVKDGGTVIVSVPNMGHFDVFLHLFVRGDWPDNDRGIFDRTHFQMFTRKRLLRVIADASLECVSVERKLRARDQLRCRFSQYPVSWLFSRFFKDLFTFQFIAVTKKPAADSAVLATLQC